MLIPAVAYSFEYETRLENSVWRTESSPFACRLKHEIDGYGNGQFVHLAGESQRLVLDGLGYEFIGKVQVVIDPPEWRPSRVSRKIKVISPTAGEIAVKGELTTEVLAALADGMLVGFKGILKESNRQPFEVSMSTVGFHTAYEEYKRCEDGLLPASYEQLKRSRVNYPTGKYEISNRGRRLLDKILAYMKTDNTIRQIFVDGHTDNSGMPRDNVTLSQNRASGVTEYLIEHGCPPGKIVTRYHGEKYPVAGNHNTSNMARNRRTTIRLSRVPPGAITSAMPKMASEKKR